MLSGHRKGCFGATKLLLICHSLTLGTHAQRGLLQLSCVCVCLLSHISLTGVSFHPEYAVMHTASNEGQNICGVFSKITPLQRSSIPSNDGNTYRWPFVLLHCRESASPPMTAICTGCHFSWLETSVANDVELCECLIEQEK